MATEAEGQTKQEIDIDEFLKEARIDPYAQKLLKQSNVSLEYLIKLNENELKKFSTDVLSMDTLSKYRLIKSIQKLKRMHEPKKLKMQTVIVSSLEYEAMSSLYEEYNKTSSAIKEIQEAIHILNNFELNEIEDNINIIINTFESKRKSLLDNVDHLLDTKMNILNKQMSSMQHNLEMISQSKAKYEQSTKDEKERKKLILNMSKYTMNVLTAPNIQFDAEEYIKRLNNILSDIIKLNDCDHPLPMQLKLKKVSNGAIYVEYALNKEEINSDKKILEIVLEYALIPKKYTKQIKKRKELNIDNMNMDSLKWIKNENKIKCHRNEKKNKYKIEDITSFRGYLMRMRARNETGWSPYSNALTVMSKECVKILRFSNTFRSKDGLTVSSNRKSVTRISTGHKYILADVKPVFKGKHCWRVKVTNNKHWIFFGVSERKIFTDSNYSNSYGCSGSTQYYNNSNSMVKNNAINTSHLHKAQFVDILLNVDKGTLDICEVGPGYDGKEAKLWGLPKTHGYVPSFNIHGQGIEIRLAQIAISWYGKPKSIKFK